MKKFILVIVLIVAINGISYAACSMTPGAVISYPGQYGIEYVVPLACSCDGSGGTISATSIPNVGAPAQLIAVEAVPGASVAAVSATITNERGTKIWGIDNIDTSGNQIYGGHTEYGVFPWKDSPWTFESGDLGADGSITFYLKLAY